MEREMEIEPETVPLLRPIFLLTKKDIEDFDRDAVTQLLRLTPTDTRGPELSKGKIMCGPNIQEISSEMIGETIIPAPAPPYQSILHAYWTIELSKIPSWGLEEPLQQLEQMLRGKEAEICRVCEDYNLTADLIVRVFAESFNMPDLTIPNESVSFWASIGATIGFDFYLD